MMESRKPMMLFSNLPGGAVEDDACLNLLPDLVQEVPARGAIRNSGVGQRCELLPFVVCQIGARARRTRADFVERVNDTSPAQRPFTDDKAALAFAVKLCRVGEVLLRRNGPQSRAFSLRES